jgi:hypothetical protein
VAVLEISGVASAATTLYVVMRLVALVAAIGACAKVSG